MFSCDYRNLILQLHVYATLLPTDEEAEQPYFSTLVPYDDPPMPVLDNIVRTVLTLQFHSLHVDSGVSRLSGKQDLDDRVRSGGSGDGETSGDDESDGQSGSDHDDDDSEDRDGDDSEDIGVSSTPLVAPIPSPVRGPTTHTRPVGTSASSLTRGKVEELLLDQRILFKMRLRIVKLEIQQYVTSECTGLREFIAALVAPPVPTIAPGSTGTIVEPGLSVRSPQDVHGRGTDPLPTPIDMGVDTGRSQPLDGAYSAPCTDEEYLLVETKDLPHGATTEPSYAAGVSDVEFDDYNVTDGEGVADVPVPAPVPEVGGRVPTTRRRSAQL
ncbi:Hypothetical predicted protein [Olea europaea subsp. europaea]|uniref:Uncharacterized protein n=1 Tax=Olea europaea subsp. europaea TaxID=158383 RepID=A0A8S0TQ79_OLEEU|nr:Hypothetical predicted protein [Olea europaea subsp. europaea]